MSGVKENPISTHLCLSSLIVAIVGGGSGQMTTIIARKEIKYITYDFQLNV